MYKKTKLLSLSLLTAIALLMIGCAVEGNEKVSISPQLLQVDQSEIGFPEAILNSSYSKEAMQEYQLKAKKLEDVQSKNYEAISKIPGVEGMGPTFLKNGTTALIVTVQSSITQEQIDMIPSTLEGIPVIVNKGDLPGGTMLSSKELILEHDIIEIKKALEEESRSLNSAMSFYTNSCTCGYRYSDNCAHFLGNALIKAGYTMNSGISAKCSHGRPIRAKEVRTWASRFSSQFSTGPSSGTWLVYQESSRYQGHVLIRRYWSSTSYSWRGTTDLPHWPVQWHYKL